MRGRKPIVASLGKVEPVPGPRRHCAGWCSPLAKRRWLQGRKLVATTESRAGLEAAFPVASGVVLWKAQNQILGHPLIGLDH